MSCIRIATHPLQNLAQDEVAQPYAGRAESLVQPLGLRRPPPTEVGNPDRGVDDDHRLPVLRPPDAHLGQIACPLDPAAQTAHARLAMQRHQAAQPSLDHRPLGGKSTGGKCIPQQSVVDDNVGAHVYRLTLRCVSVKGPNPGLRPLLLRVPTAQLLSPELLVLEIVVSRASFRGVDALILRKTSPVPSTHPSLPSVHLLPQALQGPSLVPAGICQPAIPSGEK